MQYRRGVGAVAFAAALCCVAGHTGRCAVDRTDPAIVMEAVPYYERIQETPSSWPILLMPEGLDKRIESARRATNPLFATWYYYRARVTNRSPTPLEFFQAYSIIRHESGLELANGDPVRPEGISVDIVTVIPPGGQTVVDVNLFGSRAEHQPILPGRYEIRIVFRTLVSGEEYTSPPVSVTLSAEQILEYIREN